MVCISRTNGRVFGRRTSKMARFAARSNIPTTTAALRNIITRVKSLLKVRGMARKMLVTGDSSRKTEHWKAKVTMRTERRTASGSTNILREKYRHQEHSKTTKQLANGITFSKTERPAAPGNSWAERKKATGVLSIPMAR